MQNKNKPGRFDEVVFVDNFFRSSDNLLSSHPANRRFLRRTFGPPATRLGMSCRELAARSEGGELDVAAMMRALGLPPGPPGWAKTCVADLSRLLDRGLMPRFTTRTLVIGWGMPPSLMHLLDQQGVSFLDVEIAPIRFATHLNLCARSNDRQIEVALKRRRIDDEVFWNEATVLQGYFSRRSAPSLFHADLRIGLFCGQSAIDLALVSDGKIARPIDALDKVRSLAKEVDVLVIKPHPYEPEHSQLADLASGIPNVAWTDANFYALLCADNLSLVCGLSSGALREAPYFQKEVVQLIEPDRNNRATLPPACSDWIPVGPGIACVDFLADGCMAHPVASSATASRFPNDALDRVFGLRWGLDAQNAGLGESPALQPGRTYSLRDGSLPAPWLSFGWGNPGNAGVAVAAARACIVMPLAAGSWPDGAVPAIRINGKPCRQADKRFRLSALLEPPAAPRLLVLDIEVGDRAGFRLRELCVRAAVAGAPTPAPPNSATTHAAAAATLVGLALGAAALLAGTVESAAADAGTSPWTAIKQSVVSRVHTIRDDIHSLLQRHEV